MESTLTTLSPLVIDIIFAALILLVACIKAKIGFFQSVMKVVVIILAIAIGLVCSKVFLEPVSGYIWEKYGPIVETQFDNKVEKVETGGKSGSDIFKEVWNETISGFNSEKLNSLIIQDSDIDFDDAEMVQKLKVYTLAKAKMVCDKVVKIGLFFLSTAIALLVLTIIKNIIGDLANFSVIGWVNHGLGFLFGALEMTVILLLIVRGAGLLGIPFFVNLSEGTVLLNWLIGGDVAQAFDMLKNFSFDDFKNIDLKNFTNVDFKSVGDQMEDVIRGIDTQSALDKVRDAIQK